jgi:hypothetical protein
VGVLENGLRASGGLDLWRLTRRFIVHMSITGDLCSTKCSVHKRAINIAIPLGEIPIDIIAGKQYFKRAATSQICTRSLGRNLSRMSANFLPDCVRICDRIRCRFELDPLSERYEVLAALY